MKATSAFQYPSAPHVRRHGPAGYASVESYREWLRDEFCFRCVFCLRREQWGPRTAAFHIEHLVPQKLAPELAYEYNTHLYACARCNSVKNARLRVPDPTVVAFGQCVRIRSDGQIETLNDVGECLVDLLALDNRDLVQYRRLMLDMLSLLCRTKRSAYIEWMQFPSDLPDLSSKPAPRNSRPQGITESWFARKRRGELPDTY